MEDMGTPDLPEPEAMLQTPPIANANGAAAHVTTTDSPPPGPRVTAKPPSKKHQRPRHTGDSVIESVEGEMQLNDAMALRDQLELLVPDGELKIHISRRAPKVGPNGENVCGTLETVDEMIDEDYIKETWGGGTFGLTVQTPRSDGRYKIFRRFQLKIAGEPKMHGRVLVPGGGSPAVVARDESDSLATRAFDAMQNRETKTQERLDHLLMNAGKQGGLDVAALQAVMAPITAQLAAAQETIRELQQAAIVAANKEPPRDEFRDTILKEVLTGDRSEAEKVRQRYEDKLEDMQKRYEDRIDRLVEDHAGQIKRMTEDHTRAIQRLEDRHTDELKSMERRHEREMDTVRKLTENTDLITKAAYEMKSDALKESATRLERELNEKNAKIGSLEAKKEQTLFDKAEEIGKLREVLDDLGGGAEKDEKWYERLINAVGNSEAAVNWLNKLTGGPGPDGQVQQQQLPPPNVPFRGPDGQVYVHDGAGNYHLVMQPARPSANTKKKKRAQAQADAAAGGDIGAEEMVEEAAPAAPPPNPPDPKDLARAISFIENALRSKDANPETFARGAQSLVPADVLAYVCAFPDADALLATIKVPQGSPITSVKGRNFMRAVHKILREGAPG
ncbi:MAG TPA: hypothetical protein VFD36_29335 [Kofleriaceae bacterium]|nr:hypothetical protein [Kofleriaceae bacterium]